MAKDDKAAKSSGKARAEAADEPRGLGQRVAEAKDFFEQAQAELKKVVWPTRQETTATSIAVFAVVLVMGLFLGLVDTLLSKIVALVLS